MSNGYWGDSFFITYGDPGFHYFQLNGQSLCTRVVASPLTKQRGMNELPETVNETAICSACFKRAPLRSMPGKGSGHPAKIDCQKVSYYSEKTALEVLNGLKKRGRTERSVYYCSEHAAWHLTSKAKSSNSQSR